MRQPRGYRSLRRGPSSRSDHRPSHRLQVATLLIKRGYSVEKAGTLTGVPPALLELVLQHEQRGQKITHLRPDGTSPRRSPVGTIALGLTLCSYLAWAPQVRPHHGTLFGVLTYLTVALVGALTVLIARQPRTANIDLHRAKAAPPSRSH